MKLYDISGEQFSAMDAPRHLMTEEGTAQTTLDRSLGICQVAELEGKVTREVLEEVMEEDCERLLIRGDAQITRDGADYLAVCGIRVSFQYAVRCAKQLYARTGINRIYCQYSDRMG